MAGEEYLICYLFYQLDALGEWNLCLIAVIAHFIIILQPLVSIKLRLKIPSGNVNHSHILAHNNDIQSNMSVMIVSMPLLEVVILAPAFEFDRRLAAAGCSSTPSSTTSCHPYDDENKK